DSDKFLPQRYLATKTRELIEFESVKSIQELAEQLNIDHEASRVLLATLHREVIEQDNRLLRDRIRAILSALTDFKTLAQTDSKFKGLALGPLASPERPQARKVKVTTCSFCGKMLENARKCQNCGNPVLRCSICRLSVAFEENTATCPECGSIFHQGHLEEWLKIKGNCPVCNHAF
ncbi:MAG: RING finger protein, partial [Candidatus Hodarchaeales archaeon]